jgi:hypothetical protein
MGKNKILLISGIILSILGIGGVGYDIYMWFWGLDSLRNHLLETTGSFHILDATFILMIPIGLVSLVLLPVGLLLLVLYKKQRNNIQLQE